jgi:hypothetical protein
MPKKPVDYSKCMFYRLVCRDPTVKEVYVGHTTAEVDRRANHKTNCTNEKSKKYNYFVYRFIRDHGSWDNWQLIVHEKKPVKDIFEAVLQERVWVEFYKATLNSNVPSRTHVEYSAAYYAKYRDEIMKTHAEYRADHRDQINKNQAAYDANHRDEKASYRAANRALINEKHACPCGGKFTTVNQSKHIKAARHIAYQATL